MKALKSIAIMLGLVIVLNLMGQHFEWYGWIAIAVALGVYGYVNFWWGFDDGCETTITALTKPCNDPKCPIHGKKVSR